MKALAATRTITPKRFMDMGAGAKADELDLMNALDEPLEANAVAIWPDDNGQPVLFVTLDLLYTGPLLRGAVERAAYPLSPDRILLAASHTHTAPMTDPTKPGLGAVDSEYVLWLQGILTDLVSEVLDLRNAAQATISIGFGTAHHSVNRRLKRPVLVFSHKIEFNTVNLAPNFNGPTDETLNSAKLCTENGEPIAYLWNYACHPVSHPNPLHYSAHYISVVRDALRSRSETTALPVLFFQGFSGNTRPVADVGFLGVKGLIRRIVNGPSFRGRMREDDYERWTTSLADAVLSIEDCDLVASVNNIAARRRLHSGGDFVEGLNYPVAFQQIRLGDSLTFVAVSAEVMAEYAQVVRSLSSMKVTFCVGCTDHTYGYLPTGQMVAEGGYEGERFCEAFGFRRVQPSIEEVALQEIRDLMQEVGGNESDSLTLGNR